MKYSKLFITLCITLNSLITYAQEYAVDKSATWVSLTAGFTSQGGDLYGRRQNTFDLAPSFSHFLVKNFFIGAAAEFRYLSEGSFNTTILGIGPHLGAAAGSINSTVFPYLITGFRLRLEMVHSGGYHGQENKGTDLAFGVGMVAALKAHLGLTFEAAFHLMKLSNEQDSETGNITSIGLGLTGLFFKGTSAKPVP